MKRRIDKPGPRPVVEKGAMALVFRRENGTTIVGEYSCNRHGFAEAGISIAQLFQAGIDSEKQSGVPFSIELHVKPPTPAKEGRAGR